MRQSIGASGDVDDSPLRCCPRRQRPVPAAVAGGETAVCAVGAAAYLYAQGPQTANRCAMRLSGSWARSGGGRPGTRYCPPDAGCAAPYWFAGRAGVDGCRGRSVLRRSACCPLGRVPVRLNGVWLNWLNATKRPSYTRMSDVPPAERDQAKARIADFVQDRFQGMMLTSPKSLTTTAW